MLAGAKKNRGMGGKRLEVIEKMLVTMLMLISHPLYC